MESRYQVENMKCNGCVSAVKSALEQLDSIEIAEVDLDTKIAVVTGEANADLIERTLADIGYPAKRME